MVEKEYLAQVYDLHTQADVNSLYSDWAPSYDRELIANGYRSPQRCAEALAQFVPFDRSILDVGCGTGLSGHAMRGVGFTNLSGQDVNAEMVDVARAAGIYEDLRVADLEDPFPFTPGRFDAMAAVGVIGAGAAPVSLLNETLAALAPGGHLVFSFNDHVLEDPAYTGVLDDVVASGVAENVFCEYGPHIEKLGSGANVYVLRRLTAGA